MIVNVKFAQDKTMKINLSNANDEIENCFYHFLIAHQEYLYEFYGKFGLFVDISIDGNSISITEVYND